jgi:hypothetical protein
MMVVIGPIALLQATLGHRRNIRVFAAQYPGIPTVSAAGRARAFDLGSRNRCPYRDHFSAMAISVRCEKLHSHVRFPAGFVACERPQLAHLHRLKIKPGKPANGSESGRVI